MVGTMKRSSLLFTFIISLVFILVPPSPAGFVPYISGQSTATLIESGDFTGMYRYDISINWKTRFGLSQIDLLLVDFSRSADYEITFSSSAAASTSKIHHHDPFAVTWKAYLESSGLSLFGEDDPYIKYAPSDRWHSFWSYFLMPGRTGFGTFSFYSDIAPEYGTLDDILVAQTGRHQKIYGDLSGAFPIVSSGTGGGTGGSTPEPATITLLGLGSCFILTRKKR